MLTYDLLLGGMLLLAGLFQIGGKGKNRKRELTFLLIVFVILGVTSAIRYSTGIDYSYTYAPGYEQVLQNPDISLFGHHYEPGYMLLQKIVAFFSSNYQMIFVVTSLLIIGLFCICYAKYSSNVYLSVMLFLLLSEYYCTMNFIRQSIAGIIALFALEFLKKKKFLPYLMIILVASTFHKSALILIPFFFINLIPLNKWVLAVYSAVTALIYFNTDKIMGLVTQYWYKGYHMESVHVQSTFEWPFALAMFVQFLIIFLGSARLRKKDKSNYVYVNYAFFAFFFTLMGTRHSILDRFSIYFEFAFPLSIPLLYTCLRESFTSWWALNGRGEGEKQEKKSSWLAAGLLTVIFCGGFAIHQYALMMDHHGVIPYRTVLNQPFYQEYLQQLKQDEQEFEEQILTEEQEPVEQPIDEPIDDEPIEEPSIQQDEQSSSEKQEQQNSSDTSSQVTEDIPSEIPEGMPVEVFLE